MKRLAFVVPSSVVWSLPLYELALLTAADAEGMGIDQCPVHRGEHRGATARAVRSGRRSGDRAAARAPRNRVRRCQPRGRPARCAHDQARRATLQRRAHIRASLLRGPGLAGLPSDEHGFVPANEHGRVRGLNGVFAAGDMTTFPVKQGGIAAQQAEAAAQSRRRAPRLRAGSRAVPAGVAGQTDDRVLGPVPAPRHRRGRGRGQRRTTRPVVAAHQDRGSPPRALPVRRRAGRADAPRGHNRASRCVDTDPRAPATPESDVMTPHICGSRTRRVRASRRSASS